jgi:hypothetical protein
LTLAPSAGDTCGVAHPLLEILEAAVQRDAALPGFRGKLGVGIDHPDHTEWWLLTIGDRAVTEVCAGGYPRGLDLRVVFGPDEAAALARGEGLDAGARLHFEGDRALWSRFLERYGPRQSWIQMRAPKTQDQDEEIAP